VKFKVGDKVKPVNSNAIGVVFEVNPDDKEFPYEVEFDGPGLYMNDCFAEESLELAE
jgi:hypothetical protein